jgi:hypothetical protein
MTQLRIVIFLLAQWPLSCAVHGTQQWSIHSKQCRVGRSETGAQLESVEHQTV